MSKRVSNKKGSASKHGCLRVVPARSTRTKRRGSWLRYLRRRKAYDQQEKAERLTQIKERAEEIKRQRQEQERTWWNRTKARVKQAWHNIRRTVPQVRKNKTA